jgi:caffeoyl-CoA O-methyltransferase
MEFIDEKLDDYCGEHTSPEDELLQRVNRETHLEVLQPRMLSGHLQGRFLSMISKLKQPKRILEVGTYTGYSALCLAEGLPSDGKLITLDVNEELAEKVKEYFDASTYASQLEMRVGDATKLIPALEGPFDLVFIDADKENYSNYFDLVIDKMAKGGLIIADNVLWSGKVIEPSKENDTSTKALLEYNDKVHEDPRVENMMLPVRDGLLMALVL